MNLRLPAILPLVALSLATVAHAQNATTTPVGAVTVTIAASPDGITYAQTPFSVPLLTTGNMTGISIGKISSVTSNTLTSNGAGWSAGALSVAGSPYFVEITSGANTGRMFQITGNTDSSLTVNTLGLDLTLVGISSGESGDSFQIVQGVSLLSLLGTPAEGVVGGSPSQVTAGTIDKILINDPTTGAALNYYYDTANSQWRRVGSTANQGNLAISPRSGLHYFRIGTSAIVLDFIGNVPSQQSITRVPATGATLLSTFYPVDSTLASLGIENMSGWRKANENSVTIANSDRVVLKVGASILSFYYDASVNQWRRVGSTANQGVVAVSAVSAIRLIRSGVAGQFGEWTRSVPYSLN